MDETPETSATPQPSAPTAGRGQPSPQTGAAAKETDPYAQAGEQIAELIRRFIEDVGTLRRDARVAADSARAAHDDADRIRQEAIEIRADAEAEASRIIAGARAEVDRIRERESTRAVDAGRSVREVVDHLERAQESLAAVIGERKTSEDVVVIPDATHKERAQS